MQANGHIMLGVLLNRYQNGSPETLLAPLSKESAQSILNQAISFHDPEPLIHFKRDLLSKIHYSWLLPILKQFPRPIDQYILQSLPDHLAKSLSQSLKKPYQAQQFPTSIKHYFLHLFSTKLEGENVLPIPYLPPSDLNSLTEFHKAELVQICDFLGLQDLAENVRSIVDKKKLNEIYRWLSPKKQHYLKMCLHQKNQLPLPKLDLTQFGKDFEQLQLLLHRRGLLRLAKALSGQHPDLIWHLTRILDTGRGTFINQHYTIESIPGITPILIQQLLNLINLLKPSE